MDAGVRGVHDSKYVSTRSCTDVSGSMGSVELSKDRPARGLYKLLLFEYSKSIISCSLAIEYEMP
jgi:hypothetical protein